MNVKVPREPGYEAGKGRIERLNRVPNRYCPRRSIGVSDREIIESSRSYFVFELVIDHRFGSIIFLNHFDILTTWLIVKLSNLRLHFSS